MIHHIHYTDSSFSSSIPIVNVAGLVDTLEFPYYYSEGDTDPVANVASPLSQFKSYPLPRFLPGHHLNRNVNMAKAMKMAEINNNNLNSSSDTNAVPMAVGIQNELAENWNYYYNFSEHISNFGLVMRNHSVSHTANVNAAYIYDINNSGKKYPLAGLKHRAQLDVSAHPNSSFHSCDNIDSIIKVTTGSSNPYQTNMPNPRCLIRCPFLEATPPHSDCFVDSGTLYTRNNAGQIIHPANAALRPSWSPLASNRKVYQPDGREMVRLFHEFIESTNNYYVDADAVKRIKLIEENNETVSAYGNATLVGINKIDSLRRIENFTDSAFPGLGLTDPELMGLYQSFAKSNIDIDFRDTILKSPYSSIDLNLPADCRFISYFVDGHDNTQFAYKYLRNTNSDFRGNPTLTTSIYPQGSSYWYADVISGDITGWSYVTRARNTELNEDLLGFHWHDKWFSPYVNAGSSSNETDDMRPGQFLGFLKAVDILGVDFFIPGYYRETIAPANWGRSYCWQMAMPVYAQALNSRTFDFFENGYLLDGDVPWNLAVPNPATAGYKTAYRFNTTKPDELVAARKMNGAELYLIAGTLQATSGYAGTFGLTTDVSINLKDTGSATPVNITFPIRRQGSTYIFDVTDIHDQVFWQLDKWHQYEHPERWSKDFDFEAEVMDNMEATCTRNPLPGVFIKTEDNNNPHVPFASGIFTDYTSYIGFETPSPLEYRFQPRNDGVDNNYTFYIKARANDTLLISGLTLTLTDLDALTTKGNWKINCINNQTWNWYGIDACSGDSIVFDSLVSEHHYLLSIVPMTPELEIDRIYLATPGSAFSPALVAACGNDVTIAYSQNAFGAFANDTVSHQKIKINANVDLNLNGNFTFENCIFTLEANSTITLATGQSLTLTNCGFSSCNEMWGGIINSGVSIQCTGTTIQDAIRAFSSYKTGTVTVDHSLFDKNLTAIYSEQAGAVDVQYSIFDCSGITNPISGYHYYRSIDHVDVTENDAAISNSIFRHALRTGIIMSETGDLAIQDCSFERNTEAIRYDIPINGATLNVARNKIVPEYDSDGFMQIALGITVWGSVNNDIILHIDSNSITDCTRPILLMNINNASNTTNNISGNNLQLTRTVEQLDGNNYRGIKLVNCLGVDISNDTIIWKNSLDDGTDYSDFVQGIRFESTAAATVSENLIEKTGSGICLFANCGGINFTCNTMNKCWTGVYLDVNGNNIISDQKTFNTTTSTWESNRNHWFNMKNPDEYEIIGNVNTLVPSHWYYNSTDLDDLDPTKMPSTLATYLQPITCSNSLGTCAPPNTLLRGGDSLIVGLSAQERDSLFGDVVGDSAYFRMLDPEFFYNAQMAFFEAAKADSTILFLGAENDSIYIAVYDSLQLTNMGLTVDARQHIQLKEYSQASDILSEIVNPNTLESNVKFVLETYLNYYLPADSTDSTTTITPDSTVIEQLDEIALQHPFYGGKGVYLAQSLIHKDYEPALPHQRLKQEVSQIKQKELNEYNGKMYPNPGENLINYSYINDDGKVMYIMLQNSVGGTIMQQQLTGGHVSINTSSLPNGIYYYIVKSNGSIQDKGKIIINH